MPVTARLSRRFYERLGDDIANELVDWFNAVDAAYRADLERLNEINFQRFDAKVEQRFAQADTKFEQRIAQSEAKLEQRIAQSEAKFEQRIAQSEAKLEQRIGQVEVKFEQRFAELEQRIAESETRVERRMTEFDAKLDQRTAELRSELRAGLAGQAVSLARQRAEVIKWMFVFWVGTVVPLGGLMVALLQG